MTNAGDQGDKPQSEASEAAASGGYEPPPIEQSQGQPSHQPPPGATPPSAPPPPGYPPPSYPPPGGYPPPPGYPSAGAPPGGYPTPGYQDPTHGAPSYSSPPQYGGTPPGGGYAPPPSYAPGYGEYPGGYGSSQQGTNTLAIGSLVASLIGVLCGIGSIVGIVLGIIALNQIKRTREGGHGLAVAGIAVGAVSLIISLILNFYWFSH